MKSVVALQRIFEACMPRMPSHDQSTQPSKTRYPSFFALITEKPSNYPKKAGPKRSCIAKLT
jgi:hypothetical protein